MAREAGSAVEQKDDGSRKPHPEVAEELAKLKFEKKNQSMAKLPPNLTVERRPLLHPPVASPFAGASVQKVVYVSRNTPIMSAVKRVKKLLIQVEKRAMQGVDLTKDRNGMRKLAEANEKLGKNGEAVLVKASGRAMEQALRVAEWFRNREDELPCKVEVRTGSVQAVDDLVPKDEVDSDHSLPEPLGQDESTMLWEKSTLDNDQEQEVIQRENAELSNPGQPEGDGAGPGDGMANPTPEEKQRRRRGKRKRKILEDGTEARLRWVKTVEVSISLRC